MPELSPNDIELQALRGDEELAAENDLFDDDALHDSAEFEIELDDGLGDGLHDDDDDDELLTDTQFRDGFQTNSSPLGWMNRHRRVSKFSSCCNA
jgi:hypothetical protein